jgi:hypothetical protein
MIGNYLLRKIRYIDNGGIFLRGWGGRGGREEGY